MNAPHLGRRDPNFEETVDAAVEPLSRCDCSGIETDSVDTTILQQVQPMEIQTVEVSAKVQNNVTVTPEIVTSPNIAK